MTTNNNVNQSIVEFWEMSPEKLIDAVNNDAISVVSYIVLLREAFLKLSEKVLNMEKTKTVYVTEEDEEDEDVVDDDCPLPRTTAERFSFIKKFL